MATDWRQAALQAGRSRMKTPAQAESQPEPEYEVDSNAGQPRWGNDPRGAAMNEIERTNRAFDDRIHPALDFYEREAGYATEADRGYQTDIQNALRDIYSGGGSSVGGRSSRSSGGGGSSSGGGGGGGGGGSYNFDFDPITQERISYTDPFTSYAGFQDFSQTGGFSEADIANLRARGISPVRAAYANAEREVNRQRGLQGGYAPNAIAAQARMAREQSQSTADAAQNVEALIADQRQKGRLAGLTGMSGIETSRLGADIDVGKFNAQGAFDVAQYNADQRFRAQQAGASASAAAAATRQRAAAAAAANSTARYGISSAARSASEAQRLGALQAASLDRSRPGGNSELMTGRHLQAIDMLGSQGINSAQNVIAAGRNPGQFEQSVGRVNTLMNITNRGLGAIGALRPSGSVGYRP